MLPAGLVQAQIWISTVGSILELLLIVRIIRLRLSGAYRAFFAYLICDLSRDLCLRVLEHDLTSEAYASAWALSAPIVWVPMIFAVIEFCRSFYRVVPATREVRWTIVGATVLASVVITLGVSAELLDDVSAFASSWQNVVRISNRFVFMACAMTLWTQRIYFAHTRPTLPRNLRVHRNAFTLWLSADATLRFVSGLSDLILAMQANIICSLLFCASLMIWLAGVRAEPRSAEASAITPERATGTPGTL